MIIALDYDNTYSLDPNTWNAFISLFQANGHRVIGVTLRSKCPDNSFPVGLEVICCAYKAKRQACLLAGAKIDVWIDDQPEFIEKDYQRVFLLISLKSITIVPQITTIDKNTASGIVISISPIFLIVTYWLTKTTIRR